MALPTYKFKINDEGSESLTFTFNPDGIIINLYNEPFGGELVCSFAKTYEEVAEMVRGDN